MSGEGITKWQGGNAARTLRSAPRRIRAARALYLALALLALPLLAPRLALAACARTPTEPRITIVVKDPPIHYRFDVATPALAQSARENGVPVLDDEIPLGLTIGRYDLGITVQAELQNSAGATCAELHGARIEIGLKQLDVLVDRRFAQGSCQRDAVLAHEGQHVAAFREALRYYLPIAAQTLATAPLPERLIVTARQDARASFLDPITELMQPILAAMSARATAANAALDTPQNYADVLRHCASW
jgi:hypothetical protein